MFTSDCDIIRWEKKYRNDFIRLNREWIERYFRLEPCDLRILGDPESEIINKGGEIFFAVRNDIVIGTCALAHHPETGRYELAKMAVSPDSQGHGTGYKLGNALIAYARKKGIKKLFLEANTRLEASVRLYYKLGFKAVEMQNAEYERCDLYMEMEL